MLNTKNTNEGVFLCSACVVEDEGKTPDMKRHQ